MVAVETMIHPDGEDSLGLYARQEEVDPMHEWAETPLRLVSWVQDNAELCHLADQPFDAERFVRGCVLETIIADDANMFAVYHPTIAEGKRISIALRLQWERGQDWLPQSITQLLDEFSAAFEETDFMDPSSYEQLHALFISVQSAIDQLVEGDPELDSLLEYYLVNVARIKDLMHPPQ